MKKYCKHKILPLKGYHMIYLVTSPFISNIAISFIDVNLTLIFFKTQRERERKTCY